MGMTMSQKILAKHAGLEKVESGQLILAKVDLVHGNDITTPVAIREREKIQGKGVFDEEKVILGIVGDVYFPISAEDKGEYDGNDDEPKDFGKARRTGEGGKRSTDSCKGGFGSWK